MLIAVNCPVGGSVYTSFEVFVPMNSAFNGARSRFTESAERAIKAIATTLVRQACMTHDRLRLFVGRENLTRKAGRDEHGVHAVVIEIGSCFDDVPGLGRRTARPVVHSDVGACSSRRRAS